MLNYINKKAILADCNPRHKGWRTAPSDGAVGLLASPASLWLGPTIQLAGHSLSARFPIFRASEFIVFTATR